MSKLQLTLACGEYDRTLALAEGSVQPEGVDLNFVPIHPAGEIFWRMLRHEEFDASELSLSNYMMSIASGEDRFIALPVFPYRTFRHGSIWINTESGIEKPQDLVGKRIGCPEYTMTALLFVRGLLEHEYGVRPQDVEWVMGRPERVDFQSPPGVRISAVGPGQTIDALLDSGDLHAVASTSVPVGFQKGSPRIRRLFPDLRAEEGAYYRKTGIYPIMHVVALRRSVYEQHRWLPRSLMKAFEQAKTVAYERLDRHASGLWSMPWGELAWDEARALLGADPYPYGVQANRSTLEAAALFSWEQSLSPRKLGIEDLFAPEAMDIFRSHT